MKTSFITSTTVAVALFSATAAARTLTVKNNCAYTIWPGLYTDLKVSPSKPDHATGWQQDSKQTVSFAVPDDWRAGRIWVCPVSLLATTRGSQSMLTIRLST